MPTIAELFGNADVVGGAAAALDNVRASCERGLPTTLPAKPHRGVWVMCGGGPSLKDSIKHIRRRYMSGETIACVNGSLKFLLDHKIVPQVCVLLDPQPLLAEQTIADARIDYLVASQCHPAVFELLQGCRVTLWHADVEDAGGLAAIIGKHYEIFQLVPGPETVPLKSLALAYGMGWREFHLYGVDSCYGGGADGKPIHHAYDQQADDFRGMVVVPVRNVATGETKEFITRTDWARQADQFNDMLEYMPDDMRLYVHGEGLIPHIWQQRRANVRRGNLGSVI